MQYHVDGFVQDCSNSSALAVELLQSCTQTLMLYLTVMIAAPISTCVLNCAEQIKKSCFSSYHMLTMELCRLFQLTLTQAAFALRMKLCAAQERLEKDCHLSTKEILQRSTILQHNWFSFLSHSHSSLSSIPWSWHPWMSVTEQCPCWPAVGLGSPPSPRPHRTDHAAWHPKRKKEIIKDITHDKVMTWKCFLHYWPFVRGIHWSPVVTGGFPSQRAGHSNS